MQSNILIQLIDLYVGEELPTELMDEVEAMIKTQPDVAHDVRTLRATVAALKTCPVPRFEDGSFQSVLFKLYAAGVTPNSAKTEGGCIQYTLPIAG